MNAISDLFIRLFQMSYQIGGIVDHYELAQKFIIFRFISCINLLLKISSFLERNREISFFA